MIGGADGVRVDLVDLEIAAVGGMGAGGSAGLCAARGSGGVGRAWEGAGWAGEGRAWRT